MADLQHQKAAWGRLRQGAGCLALLGAATFGAQADAGAWPREEGKSFLSFTLESYVGGNSGSDYLSLFYEYGLTPDLTLGLDAGHDLDASTSSAIVFLRYPVFTGGANAFAVELGLGETVQSGQTVATIRPGLYWGRGISIAGLSGWTGVDMTYAQGSNGDALGKVQATIGANLGNNRLAILDLQYEHPLKGQSFVAIAPSYVFEVAQNTRVQVGLRHNLRTGATATKVGFWLDF